MPGFTEHVSLSRVKGDWVGSGSDAVGQSLCDDSQPVMQLLGSLVFSQTQLLNFLRTFLSNGLHRILSLLNCFPQQLSWRNRRKIKDGFGHTLGLGDPSTSFYVVVAVGWGGCLGKLLAILWLGEAQGTESFFLGQTLGHGFHGVSQARIPEWVAISFSRRSSQPQKII